MNMAQRLCVAATQEAIFRAWSDQADPHAYAESGETRGAEDEAVMLNARSPHTLRARVSHGGLRPTAVIVHTNGVTLLGSG